ncbi:MAG: glycosyltransferase family 4 protein [candidate division WOR-3 bacterium]
MHRNTPLQTRDPNRQCGTEGRSFRLLAFSDQRFALTVARPQRITHSSTPGIYRVCMVSDSYLPEPGGIAEHIYHLARELRTRGHDVRILTARFPGRVWSGPADDEQFVFRIGRSVTVPANQSRARLTLQFGLGAKVGAYFARERFDIVHIHGSLAPTLPLIALSRSPALNVATFHAGHGRNLGYALFRPWLRCYFNRLNGCIAVSGAARRALARYFPGDYQIIPNGVDPKIFNPDVEPAPEFTPGRPTILFLGRFDRRKGLDYLLQALPLVKRQVRDVRCLVVGVGDQRRFLRQLDPLVRNDVVFTGPRFGPERARYYAGCDVFCAPATGRESFGIVLLEAMACARPVVATDIEGYREVVTDGIEGLLAKPRDPVALADRLIRILRDPAKARGMGQAGRRKALRYSWPTVTDRVLAFYQAVMSRWPGNSGSNTVLAGFPGSLRPDGAQHRG